MSLAIPKKYLLVWLLDPFLSDGREIPEANANRGYEGEHSQNRPSVPDETRLQRDRITARKNSSEGPRSRDVQIKGQAEQRGHNRDCRRDTSKEKRQEKRQYKHCTPIVEHGENGTRESASAELRSPKIIHVYPRHDHAHQATRGLTQLLRPELHSNVTKNSTPTLLTAPCPTAWSTAPSAHRGRS
jgi:hypothetical protein